MRQRKSVKIDRRTGERTETTEILPPAASFADRVAATRAAVELASLGGGPAEARYAHLKCDGCGAIAELDYGNPQLPPGWAERDNGDFCPACRARGR
jgi:hypothetical protein